jgi:mRNA interferase RelE/StbE
MEQEVSYEILLTVRASQLFEQIKDRREQEKLLLRLEKLKQEPEKQGKALTQELQGYRSIRAVGQRYRIIYRIDETEVIVLVIAIGRRKEGDKRDIYEITKHLLQELE